MQSAKTRGDSAKQQKAVRFGCRVRDLGAKALVFGKPKTVYVELSQAPSSIRRMIWMQSAKTRDGSAKQQKTVRFGCRVRDLGAKA